MNDLHPVVKQPNNLATDFLYPYLPPADSKWYRMDIESLRQALNPDKVMRLLKVRMWENIRQGFSPDEISVSQGLCTPDHLLRLLSRPEFALWLSMEEVSYDIRMQELLEYGLESLRGVFDLPNERAKYGKDGEYMGQEVDSRIVALKLQALRMLDMRKHGEYVKKSVSVSINRNTESISLDSPDELDDLDKKIKSLEEKVRG